MGQSRSLYVYINNFLVRISIMQIEKALMVWLGFEPAAAGWYAQTKPRSYGGHPIICRNGIRTNDLIIVRRKGSPIAAIPKGV